MGNIIGGHYTSFVRTSSNEWFHCNDTSIEMMPSPQIVTPMAYCLFYRKKNK
jgi:ubiquitin C-terminal hydrolase